MTAKAVWGPVETHYMIKHQDVRQNKANRSETRSWRVERTLENTLEQWWREVGWFWRKVLPGEVGCTASDCRLNRICTRMLSGHTHMRSLDESAAGVATAARLSEPGMEVPTGSSLPGKDEQIKNIDVEHHDIHFIMPSGEHFMSLKNWVPERRGNHQFFVHLQMT